MLQSNALEFRESRRANRMDWDRQIKIIEPLRIKGRSVNVSATGILVKLPLKSTRYKPQVGDEVRLDIPNMDNTNHIVVSGRVVRVEIAPNALRFAVDWTA